MADQQTLDSSVTQSSDLCHSQSTSSSTSSDPSLLRSLSSSRLNAGAPEFVPGRTTPPPPPPPRMIIPPPPPHGMLHMYHHQPPFNVPVLGPVPVQPPPPHLVPVQNHHPHRFPHHNPHHHNRHGNQQYVAVRNHNHPDYQQRGVGGEQETDLVTKKGDHDRRRDHKRESKNDQMETGASISIDSKTGLPEDTIQKIVNQVEYYFSDLNLATTDHLMRFISKDPEGYVPIHVVASFKKIKAVINSNSQLAAVLQNSTKLVVSDDGKKVRRLNPITESAIEELQSRIVIAENLPEDHCYQNLMKIFSTVGSVKNIRTCQPQNSGSGAPPAGRQAKTDGTLFSNKVHAFVEYEMVDLAEKAVAELNEAGTWRNGLRVRLMLKHQSKEAKQGQGRVKKGQDVEVEREEDDATTSEQPHASEKQSEDCSGEWDTHVQEITLGEEQVNEKVTGQRKGRNRGRGKGRGRGQPHHNNNNNNNNNQSQNQNQNQNQSQNQNQNQNQNHNHNHNGRGNHHHHHHHVGTPPLNNPMNHTEQSGLGKQQPPGPRMPDGTRGFSMGRGKPIAVLAE